MTLLGLLVALVVICVVIWAAQKLLAAFAIADPLRTVIWVVVVLICVFMVLGYIGAPIPAFR